MAQSKKKLAEQKFTLDTFDVNLLTDEGIANRTVKDKNTNYMTIDLKAYYGPSRVKNDIIIMGPEVDVPMGLTNAPIPGEPDVLVDKFKLVLKTNDEEHMRFAQIIEEIHQFCLDTLQKYANKLPSKYEDFDATHKMAKKLIKSPVYKGKDTDRPALTYSIFIKPMKDLYTQAVFNDVGEEQADGTVTYKKFSWNDLRDKNLKMIPLIRVRRIYVGAVLSMQIDLVKGIIISIGESDVPDASEDEYQNLRKKYPNSSRTLIESLKTSNLEKKELKPIMNRDPLDLPGSSSSPDPLDDQGEEEEEGDPAAEIAALQREQPPPAAKPVMKPITNRQPLASQAPTRAKMPTVKK